MVGFEQYKTRRLQGTIRYPADIRNGFLFFSYGGKSKDLPSVSAWLSVAPFFNFRFTGAAAVRWLISNAWVPTLFETITPFRTL
jgi:hypothetical protein